MTITGKIPGCAYTIEFHEEMEADINTVAIAVRVALLEVGNDLDHFNNKPLWAALQTVSETGIKTKIKLVALMKEQ